MDRQQDKREELAQELEQLLGAAAAGKAAEKEPDALGAAPARESDALGAAAERKPDALGAATVPAAESVRAECGFCFHPRHEGTVCEHTRTIHGDGIDIDGPCGCGGEELGYGNG